MLLTRTLELTPQGVRTVQVLRNDGTKAVPAALQVRGEFAIDDIDSAVMSTGTRLIVPGEPPNNTKTWDSPDLPVSPWSAGLVAVSFQPAQVRRSYASWTAKAHPGAAFGVWSAESTIAPGESITVEATISAAR
jgi:hypothetical protein